MIEEINRIFPYPQADEDILRVEEIFISSNGINASANFYIDNGDVEILEGSELCDFPNAENYPEIEELRQELLDEGIIFDNGQKKVFKKSFMVNKKQRSRNALSSSANLILHGSHDGWKCWTNAEGKSLN